MSNHTPDDHDSWPWPENNIDNPELIVNMNSIPKKITIDDINNIIRKSYETNPRYAPPMDCICRHPGYSSQPLVKSNHRDNNKRKSINDDDDSGTKFPKV